jgi:2-dehydro-3-deoxyphosphogluconate aldolase/(4S)-4-hydroxy-2-oxoglutarate aldolase
MREQVIRKIMDCGLVVVIRGVGEAHIVPLGEALLAGGISAMEVTFDPAHPETDAETLRAVAALRTHFGERAAVGAGTVLCAEHARAVAEAGGQFVVSPDADEAVIKETRARGLVSIPGCLTPGECTAAHRWGADFIKLFPVGELGPGYLKALRAPLSHLRFLAVGGMSVENIPGFRKAGALGFGVGGNLVNRDWIAAGQFDKITALAKEYAAAARRS